MSRREGEAWKEGKRGIGGGIKSKREREKESKREGRGIKRKRERERKKKVDQRDPSTSSHEVVFVRNLRRLT